MADIDALPDMIDIRQVLADLTFPARRWQAIAEAQHYGAPGASVTELFGLPLRSYLGIEDIVGELREQRHPRIPPATSSHGPGHRERAA